MLCQELLFYEIESRNQKMHFHTSHLELLTLLTVTSITAHPITQHRRSWKASLNVPVQPLSPALQLHKLHTRFNAETPNDVLLAITNTHTVATPVTIGDTTFNLDLDTGSADT